MWDIVNQETSIILSQGHHHIKNSVANDNAVLILYHPVYSKHAIFARVVTPDRSRTSEFVNDLKMFVIKGANNQFELVNILIHPSFMNKGYGTILMNQLIENATKRCINYIEGHLRNTDGNDDPKLQHFYAKHGFDIDEYRNILWRNRVQVTMNSS